MLIRYFPTGPFVTNAYVIADEGTGEAAIIDPAPGSAAHLKNFIAEQELTIVKILLTHSHMDHIADCAALKDFYQVPVLIHEADAPNLRKPGSDGLPSMIPIPPCEPDTFLAEGDKVRVGGLTLEVMHTPGHTPGGVCFYERASGNLISGDTLFQGSIGNLAFPTAEPEKMWQSLARLATLPPETKVYPGHGEPTSIGAESWLPNARQIFGM